MNEGLFSLLPTELLFRIFILLQREDDLIALGYVSERVNAVALSLYLSRRNCRFPQQVFEITPANCSVLRGLSRATFIKSAKYVSCTLRYPDDADMLLIHVRNLGMLLRRMTSIVHFTLTLVAREFWSPGTRDLKTDMGLLLKDAVLDVLDRATQISENVTVLRGAFLHLLIKDGSVPLPPVPLSLHGLGKSLLARITCNMSRRKQIQSIPNSSTIRTFKIHSHCLVVPPLLTWTLHTLNTSSISHLSFRACDLSDIQWGHLLAQIHVPSLTSLTLTADNLALTNISRFATRHTRLTKLELDLNLLSIPKNSIRRLTLGHITTLSAPSHILKAILTVSKSHRLINIVFRYTLCVLDIPYIDRYLTPVLPRRAALGLQVLHVNVNTERDSDPYMNPDSHIHPPSGVLHRISHIEVDTVHPFNQADMGPFIRRLAVFPALKRLVVYDAGLSPVNSSGVTYMTSSGLPPVSSCVTYVNTSGLSPINAQGPLPMDVHGYTFFIPIIREMMAMGPEAFKALEHIELQGEEKTYEEWKALCM